MRRRRSERTALPNKQLLVTPHHHTISNTCAPNGANTADMHILRAILSSRHASTVDRTPIAPEFRTAHYFMLLLIVLLVSSRIARDNPIS